jgi:6-phosphogluconolactonase
MRKPQIEIVSDSQDLAARAVRSFVSAATQAVAERGEFYTALSGGQTPELFFRRLAIEPNAIPWDKTHVFWVDERYVASDSPVSNYRLAVETLLAQVEMPRAQIHRIPTEHEDIGDAVRAYERTIREIFGLRTGEMPRFDWILLGMGKDGHTASLFPHSPAAYDPGDLACAVYVDAEVKPRVSRITLTPPALLAARKLVVLISGREKAQTLKDVLAGESDAGRYPIRLLWPVLDRVEWLVDREAAGELGEA